MWYNVLHEVIEVRRLFSEDFKSAVGVLTTVVRSRLEHVKGADKSVNKTFFFQPDENLNRNLQGFLFLYLLLIFRLESVGIPDQHSDGVFNPVGHNGVFILAVSKGILAFRTKLIDPDYK